MPTIKITGIAPFTGEYPIDVNFTNRDLHLIKQISGVRAGEIDDALEAGDSDLVVALAVCTLRRKGHAMTPDMVDMLWDAPAGSAITLSLDEAAADPPQPSAESENEPPERPRSSGASGNGAGDYHPENSQSVTGTPV